MQSPEQSPEPSRELATLLRQSGPLSPPRAVAIVQQVASALDVGHAADLVHGDVNPENILVSDDDVTHLTDFGTARTADRRKTTNIQTDVSALAGVLAECLTGSPPDPEAEPPRPSRLRPGRVPAAMDGVVARGLTDAPDERYGCAGDLAAAAYEALTGPEQRQASRILRRTGGTSPPDGTAQDATGDAGPAKLFALNPVLPSEIIGPRRQIPGLSGPWKRRKPVFAGAAAVIVAAAIAAGGYPIIRPSPGPAIAAPRQIALTFTDIDYRLSPNGLALDGDSNVYVTSQGMTSRVLKVAAGSATPTVLPFNGVYQPQAVVVGADGAVYVSGADDQVLKLPAGSNAPEVLPFAGLDNPGGVAVDSAGSVYVVDRNNNQVVKLEGGSNVQTVLPFDGLRNPQGVAVDGAGAAYVADTDNNRVLKLTAGSGEQIVLPFAGITMPWGVTVDDDGSVYVTERRSNKVVKLTAGAALPHVLAFTGLNGPLAVAVNRAGTVYIADRGNDRVLKLPQN